MNEYKCTRPECKKSFERYASSVRNPERVYCSKQCKNADQARINSGENNPNYKHGGGKHKPPKKKRVRVTTEQIVNAIYDEGSFTAAAEKLGINRKTVAKVAERLEIENPKRVRVDIDRILGIKEGRSSGTRNFVRRLNLIEYLCSKCGVGDSWQGEDLVLELDHINGNPADNRLENLRWLCPNCHSQTSTYCGRKRNEVMPV